MYQCYGSSRNVDMNNKELIMTDFKGHKGIIDDSMGKKEL